MKVKLSKRDAKFIALAIEEALFELKESDFEEDTEEERQLGQALRASTIMNLARSFDLLGQEPTI